jgi:hypothetical protein
MLPRPVLWIQTQNKLFSPHKYDIKRLIEFKTFVTLNDVASWQDTAQSMTRETLGISKNIKEIYDKNEDQVEAKAAPPTINEFAAASPAVVAAPIAVTVSPGPVAAIADEPLMLKRFASWLLRA